MWNEYRRTVIPTQAMILTICLILLYAMKLPGLTVAGCMVTMQVGAVIGAWRAARIRRRRSGRSQRDRLPLAPA